MKTLTTSLALLAAVALTVGCQRTGDTEIGSATQAVKAQHAGPEQHLIKALFSLDLRPDQREALEVLVTDAQVTMLPVKQSMADLMREAGKQIRKGQINEKRLRVLAENLKGEFFKARPSIILNLNKVHKTLDKSQREQLVASLRKLHQERMSKRFGADSKHRGFHGHGPGHKGRRHKMRRVAEKLGLTPKQQGDIKDVIRKGIDAMREGKEAPVARPQSKHEKIQAAVDSFLSEKFDAAKLPFLDKPQGPGLEKLDKVLKIGKLILPIFSAEQRDKIATHLEYRADIVSPAMD